MAPNFYESVRSGCLDDIHAHDGPIQRYLLICTAPRTAGHFLCAKFGEMGWGMPVEYFDYFVARDFYNRWTNQNIASDAILSHALEYGKQLQQRTARNGIFSAKIFPNNVPFLVTALPAPAALTSLILVKRRDKKAQTISLATTLLTGMPFADTFVLKDMQRIANDDMTDEKMAALFNFTCLIEKQWENLAASHPKQQVIRLESEDIISNPQECLNRIAKQFTLPINLSKPHFEAENSAYPVNRQLKLQLQKQFGNLLDGLQREYERGKL